MKDCTVSFFREDCIKNKDIYVQALETERLSIKITRKSSKGIKYLDSFYATGKYLSIFTKYEPQINQVMGYGAVKDLILQILKENKLIS